MTSTKGIRRANAPKMGDHEMTPKTKVALAVVAVAIVAAAAVALVQRNQEPGPYYEGMDTLGTDTLGLNMPGTSPSDAPPTQLGYGPDRDAAPQRRARSQPTARSQSTSRSTSSTSWLSVPAGTPISVRLRTRLSTKTSDIGDAFSATVTRAVTVGGRTVIPAGATVRGHVAMVRQPGKASGRGQMRLYYDSVNLGGRSYNLASSSITYEGKGGSGTDAKIIGGGAAAGAVIGGVLGGSAGSAAKGAVIGGAAGTAASLMDRGPQLVFEPGTVLRFRLDNPVRVRRVAA